MPLTTKHSINNSKTIDGFQYKEYNTVKENQIIIGKQNLNLTNKKLSRNDLTNEKKSIIFNEIKTISLKPIVEKKKFSDEN